MCVCVYKVSIQRVAPNQVDEVTKGTISTTHTHTHTLYLPPPHTHSHIPHCTIAQEHREGTLIVCVCVCVLLVPLQYTYSSHQSGTFSVGTVGTEDVDCSTLDFTYVSLCVCMWCVCCVRESVCGVVCVCV